METETDKALNLLIHDLRAPLSVAQGYLRLLKENRLASPEDREKALAQTMEVLGRMTRLCADAAAFVAPAAPDVQEQLTEPTRPFVARVEASAAARGLAFEVSPEHLRGVVRGRRLDLAAESVAFVLGTRQRGAGDAGTHVTVLERDGDAFFLVGSAADREALLAETPQPFDPWRGGHGLALPLACRTVGESGGRIWTVASARHAAGIALPQEWPNR